MDKKINETNNSFLYNLEDLENKIVNIEKAFKYNNYDSKIKRSNYIKEMDKIDEYKVLYNSVQITIVHLFSDCKDKNLIKKYKNILSNEMKNLEIYSEKNKYRLHELKKELNNLIYGN